MNEIARDVLAGRTSPVLRDGTTIADLVDLERREVALRVLSDPEIHRLEMEKIFSRAWIGIAHEAEIPNSGDFVLRYIGEDRVIITRTPKGAIEVLLNVCSHRGFEVCWAESGNAGSFKCPYHGWAFDTSGNLLGAPLDTEMYGNWDKSKYGLRRARVEVFDGIVYASFDTSGATLKDWLGPAAWYLERSGNADRIPVGPPTRFHVNANWKTFMDTAAGDDYHPVTLHRGVVEMGVVQLPGTPGSRMTLTGMNNVLVTSAQGNNTLAFAEGFPLITDFDVNSEDFLAYENRVFATTIFPQSVVWGTILKRLPDGRTYTTGTLTQIMPTGPESFLFSTQILLDRDAPEKVFEIERQHSALNIIALDDFEANLSQQRGSKGPVGRQQPLRYFAQGERLKRKDWPGPGIVYAAPLKDDGQWHFWRRWFQLMTDEPH
jgi:phenylpropionate dioxygenase-like ring-hydroxylating dioxygenase large terminal subunit